MGLDVSHDCWSGAYSRFHRYRTYLASLVGMDYNLMDGLRDDRQKGLPWPDDSEEALCILLNHSDCDGDIVHKDCLPLANRLKELLPKMDDEPDWKQRTEQWIEGLMAAHDAGEDVDFH